MESGVGSPGCSSWTPTPAVRQIVQRLAGRLPDGLLGMTDFPSMLPFTSRQLSPATAG